MKTAKDTSTVQLSDDVHYIRVRVVPAAAFGKAHYIKCMYDPKAVRIQRLTRICNGWRPKSPDTSGRTP